MVLRRLVFAGLFLAITVVFSTGCSTPHSRRVIDRKWERVRTLGEDLSQAKRRRQARLGEKVEDFRLWYQADAERFARRLRDGTYALW